MAKVSQQRSKAVEELENVLWQACAFWIQYRGEDVWDDDPMNRRVVRSLNVLFQSLQNRIEW